MLPPKLSSCSWLVALTSSPARIAPYRFVLAPAPPVKETLPRTRISPYQFNPPLISRSPSTIRMPDPLAVSSQIDAAGNVFRHWRITSWGRLRGQPGWIGAECLASLRTTIFIGSRGGCKVLGTRARIVRDRGPGLILIDQIVNVQRVWPGIYALDRWPNRSGCARSRIASEAGYSVSRIANHAHCILRKDSMRRGGTGVSRLACAWDTAGNLHCFRFHVVVQLHSQLS